MSSWDTSLEIMLQQCWATPTSNPRDTTKYTFIDDFWNESKKVLVVIFDDKSLYDKVISIIYILHEISSLTKSNG